MKRCNWPKLEQNKTYIVYHDTEWGTPSYNDSYLFEMLVLELFHCGLSWLIILNKRDSFRQALDQFNPNLIKDYSEEKISQLMNNSNIVRHEAKIRATINNAKCFLEVQKKWGSFSNYIWSFTNNKIVYGDGIHIESKNELSNLISKDLKKRGFKFMASITTMSYLEAIGIVNHHSKECFKYRSAA